MIALSLTACGGSSGSEGDTTADSAAAELSSIAAAEGSLAASIESTQSSTPISSSSSDAGSVDVCALLIPADASAIATQFKLSSEAGATYKLLTEKQPPPTTSYPTSACQFTIAQVTADDTGSEAIVTVTVQPAQYLDKTGTKVDGLGDEAYDEGQYVEVRTGDLVLQSNENQGASKDFIDAMYRAMIPHIT